MLLSEQVLKSYAASRGNTYKSIVCHAPFVNLNFEQNGNVRACCYNREDVLGKWPEQSIREIWNSTRAQRLRERIRNNDLGGGCTDCGKMIVAGNHQGVRARYFDDNVPGNLSSGIRYLRNKLYGYIDYPRVMEFELSNKCNLECVMCNGYFSSSIRKNREKLPPILSPYNEKFVTELEEFIPHLTDAKFLGGEPFMIDIYLLIWERIRKINPGIRIHITTNGTFLTDRVKDLLEGLNAGIIISIDSVVKETYEKIRVNGSYERVMAHLEYFRHYAQRKKTFISIAACPVIYNWKELPGMLEFCLSKNVALYFNAVFTPFEVSLREQTIELQEEILAYLERYPLPEVSGTAQSPRNLSIWAYRDFVKLLKSWVEERKTMIREKTALLAQAEKALNPPENSNEPDEWSLEKISNVLLEITAVERKGLFEEEKRLKSKVGQLLISIPKGKLNGVIFRYLQLYESYNKLSISSEMYAKADSFATLIDDNPQRNRILLHLATLSPLFFAQWFCENTIEQIKERIRQAFIA
ncbi:MAG TPA: radical SAM protein [Chitinophagales bacterium]|nr:radical SAM protein [Chitinophagales bacterium]